MPIIKGVTITNHPVPPGALRTFFYTPYCEGFKKADLQTLELLNSSADPKPSELQKESFSYSAPYTKNSQTNLERVPVTKAMGANYKRGDNYKPSRASRGSTHLLLYSVLRRV